MGWLVWSLLFSVLALVGGYYNYQVWMYLKTAAGFVITSARCWVVLSIFEVGYQLA